jgi:hypothetical protein
MRLPQASAGIKLVTSTRKKYNKNQIHHHRISTTPGGVHQPHVGDYTPAETKAQTKEARHRYQSSSQGQVSSERNEQRLTESKKMLLPIGKAGDFFTSSLRPQGTVIKIRGGSGSSISLSNSNALPLLYLKLELSIALLEILNVGKLPLSGLAGCQGVARSLQCNLV